MDFHLGQIVFREDVNVLIRMGLIAAMFLELTYLCQLLFWAYKHARAKDKDRHVQLSEVILFSHAKVFEIFCVATVPQIVVAFVLIDHDTSFTSSTEHFIVIYLAAEFIEILLTLDVARLPSAKSLVGWLLRSAALYFMSTLGAVITVAYIIDQWGGSFGACVPWYRVASADWKCSTNHSKCVFEGAGTAGADAGRWSFCEWGNIDLDSPSVVAADYPSGPAARYEGNPNMVWAFICTLVTVFNNANTLERGTLDVVRSADGTVERFFTTTLVEVHVLVDHHTFMLLLSSMLSRSLTNRPHPPDAQAKKLKEIER